MFLTINASGICTTMMPVSVHITTEHASECSCLTRTVLAARVRSLHSNEIKSCVLPLIVT
jgi:hypothetical protein